jgi:hypothetical protein
VSLVVKIIKIDELNLTTFKNNWSRQTISCSPIITTHSQEGRKVYFPSVSETSNSKCEMNRLELKVSIMWKRNARVKEKLDRNLIICPLMLVYNIIQSYVCNTLHNSNNAG